MGYILRLCFTAYFVYGVVLGQANADALKIYNNPTTYFVGPNGGSPAVNVRGGSIVSAKPVAPIKVLPHGGLGQSVNAAIEIPATRTNGPVRVPVKAHVSWRPPTVKTALKFGLKGLRASGWGLVVGWAIGEILERSGFFGDPNDEIVKLMPNDGSHVYCLVKNRFRDNEILYSCTYDINAVCAGVTLYNVPFDKPRMWGASMGYCTSPKYPDVIAAEILKLEKAQYLRHTGQKKIRETMPISDADIDNLDLGNYQPKTQAEIDFIRRYLPAPDAIVWDNPKYDEPPEIITSHNDDGSTTVSTINRSHDFTITGGQNGQDINIKDQITTTTESYTDGKFDGRTTTTTTVDHQGHEQPTTATDAPQKLDCELVPTLCQTQKEQLERDKARDEWLKELPPDEPDLSQLSPKEIDIKREFTIDFGSKTCPSSVPIHLSSIGIGSQFDFTLVCDFAVKLRLILLSIAYLVAARILVGALK